MTICAFDGKKLVTDSALMDADSNIVGSVVKVHSLDDGRMIACAGDYQDAIAVCAWINENLTRDKGGKSFDPKAGTVQAGLLGYGGKPEINPNFAAIIINSKGEYCELEAGLYPYVSSLPVAIGSGTLIFKVAYSCGLDIEQAAAKAVEFNAYCGGQIYTYNYD